MADSSITTVLSFDEVGDLAARLDRNGSCGNTSIDGDDWQEAKRDCRFAARVLAHLIRTGAIYTTLVLDGEGR
jgi:hypothetical protein